MTLQRKENWPELLLKAIEESRSKPFEWGTHDCCTFAAYCVLTMTCVDLMEPFRGRYSSALGALKVVTEAGHATLTDAWSAALPAIAPLMAQRGDVVMFESTEGMAVGVVTGQQAIAAGPDGVTSIPMALWLRAWRV